MRADKMRFIFQFSKRGTVFFAKRKASPLKKQQSGFIRPANFCFLPRVQSLYYDG